MFIWQILDFMKKALVHGDDPDLLTAQPDLDLIEQQLQQQHLQAVQRGGLGAVAGFARPVRRSHRKLPRNDDALALLRLDKDAYRKRAADSAAASNQYLYEDPDSDIKFSPWNLDIHQTGLNIILNAPNAKVAVDRFLSFLSADPDVASTMSPYSMVDADGRHNSDGDGGDEYDQDNGNVSDDRDSFGFPIDEHTFDPLMLTDDDDDTGNGGDGGVNSADPTSTMTSNGGRNSRNSYFGGHLQDTAVAVRDYSHMFGRADPDPDPESDASTEIIEIDDRGWHKTWTEDDEDRFAESTRYSWHPSSFNSNNRES
ncbi:hypothetical protein BC831DRAFT_122487 [Entophlyctis helioformis]|nr:hypothetical protein BC831DRAFT_122487 [Entophlyctis helioformis]